MLLSTFVLCLFVLLQSFVYLSFVAVDPKLLGVVGLAFVVIAIIENLLGRSLIARRTV